MTVTSRNLAGAAAEELFAGSWTGRELYEDTSFARNDGVYAPPNTRHACGEKLLSVNADPDNDEMYFWCVLRRPAVTGPVQ